MLALLIIAVVACVVGNSIDPLSDFVVAGDVLNNSPALGNPRARLDDASWVEVLSCLDRLTLDCAERLARRFRRLVTSHLDDKCFRRLLEVKLSRVCADFSVYFAEVETRKWSKGGRCDRFQPRQFHDLNKAIDFFFFVVRCTAIGKLQLSTVTITKYFVDKLREVSSCITVRMEFVLFDVRSTPEMFRSLFAAPFVNVAQLKLQCCKLQASHIDDALLVALANANVKSVDFGQVRQPVDAAAYNVSEDAILDFLFRDEFNGVNAGDRELLLSQVAVTQNFFERLVEQNLTSRVTGRLTLKIDECVAQDTTLYVGNRTSTDTTDRYEFEAAVRFQLVISRRALEMRRGTDPEDGSPFFI